MKKLLLFILLFFTFNTSFALVAAPDFIKNLPSDFKPECYEYYTKVDNIFEENITHYMNINKGDILITQSNKVLPLKLSYQKDGIYNDYILEFDFKEDLGFDYRNLKDGNKKTFLELTLGIYDMSGKEIILKFDEEVKEYSSILDFEYSSDYYIPEFYLSSDGKKYNKIQKNNITDFSFSYLKINFIGKVGFTPGSDFTEKVKIYEISLLKDINGFMIMSFTDDDLEIYSGNKCKGSYKIYPNSFNDFSTDNNTKTFDITLTKNSQLDVYIEKDKDGDKVLDEVDNCKDTYNPFQKDNNADGRGDLCSDDDKDGIIGNKDNCIYVKNSDQKDINRNGVGDVCEFDKDLDGIYDSVDNCKYIENKNQLDTDKDGIGDVCDNCKSYNPKQLDTNQNNIGDTCEQNDKYLLENDEDGDKIVDNIDNCKFVANSGQFDFDKDGIGDSCDNCKSIQNTDQLDFNKNSIGDICEDSDSDGIEGLTDNCINIANADQKDIDNDGIGDVCEDDDRDNFLAKNDNCPFIYNPEQVDIDKDGIGDKCDETDDRYIESNSNFFIGLIILVTLGFFFGIYMMLRKLK